MIRHPIFSVPLVWLLGGCAASGPEIQTREEFRQVTGGQNEIAFEYTMYWYLPPSGNPDSKRRFWQLVLEDHPATAIHEDLDNETKLRLEDLAASKLKIRLERESICPDGYAIQEVRWLDNAVKLQGNCQS